MVHKVVIGRNSKKKAKSVDQNRVDDGSKSKNVTDKENENVPVSESSKDLIVNDQTVSNGDTGKSKGIDSSEKAERHEMAVENKGFSEVGKGESSSKTAVLAAKEVTENTKTLRKRKGGADRAMAQAYSASTRVSPPRAGSYRLRPRIDLPSFQKVLLSEKDHERIVGRRVKVLWPDSRRWFKGRIISFDNQKKLHNIRYDDGDKEELDLMREHFELEVKRSEAFTLASKSGLNHVKETNFDGEEVFPDAKEEDLLKIAEKKTALEAAKSGSSKLQTMIDRGSEQGVDMDVNVLPEKVENLVSETGDNAKHGHYSSLKDNFKAENYKFESNLEDTTDQLKETGNHTKSKGQMVSNVTKSGISKLTDMKDSEENLDTEMGIAVILEKVQRPGLENCCETESISEIAGVSSKSVAQIPKEKELGRYVAAEFRLKTNIPHSLDAAGNWIKNDGGQISLANQEMISTDGSSSHTPDEPPSSDDKNGSMVSLKSPLRRGPPRGKTKK